MYTPRCQVAAVSHCVKTAQMFRNHLITQKRPICEGVLETVRISLSRTLTSQVRASAGCIAGTIPEAVSTEVAFQKDVPLIPRFDSFASATNTKHAAFCFRQVCLWFLGAAWPMSYWKFLKCGLSLFSFMLGELGREIRKQRRQFWMHLPKKVFFSFLINWTWINFPIQFPVWLNENSCEYKGCAGAAGVCTEDTINCFDSRAGLFCLKVIKKIQTEGTVKWQLKSWVYLFFCL